MPCIVSPTENGWQDPSPSLCHWGWALQKEQCWRRRRRRRMMRHGEVWMRGGWESLLQGVFVPAPLHKTSQKSQGGSSEWPPSWGKLRISSQLSSVLWNTKWEGGPFPLLQPLWNDVKHINQYKRVFQHQSVAWSCLWLSGMEAERSWLQAWRELGILSCGDVESICF